ncbi:MAG: HD domain-containing protein [Clostridium sp.]|uniref:HD domain-containing protein n=1 Tax=Clostridium sp. TaxID=1506 RepID=UPI003F3590B4
MVIEDKIYGRFQVEKVIEEIIYTREIQRLKGIHQGGGSYLVNSKWDSSRYSHSVGVMLLIRLLGGSIEEQIAGLLHDISHTAFSHTVDVALGNKDEDYHEKIYEKIIEGSKIKEILERYNLNSEDILFNEEKWTILERKMPGLCADRVDYTLRDMYTYGFIEKEEVERFLPYLKVCNGEIVITSIEKAKWFVETYTKEVVDFFRSPLNVYANDTLGKAMKISLDLKEITLEDLMKEDKDIYSKLQNSSSKEVRNLIESLNENIKVKEDKENYNIHTRQKVRIVDPTVEIEGELFKASEKSEEIEGVIEKTLRTVEADIYIKIL